MIHVVAVITAKPGQRENILAHLRVNVPAVRAEKGCIDQLNPPPASGHSQRAKTLGC